MAQNRVFKLSGNYDQADGCTVRIRPSHPAFKNGDWEVEIRCKRQRTVHKVMLSQLIRFGIQLAAKERQQLAGTAKHKPVLDDFFGKLYQ